MADSSVLRAVDIQNAITVVENYINTCNGLYGRLETTISGLTAVGSNFNGDAQNGYNDFFRQITPALTENLTSLTSSMKDMLDGIKQTLLNQVDPQLGDANRNPGGQD